MPKLILFYALILPFWACGQIPDLILFNGNIFTSDAQKKHCSAIAIQNGYIIKVGNEELLSLKNSKTKVIDLKGKFCMPGLIEGHGHFQGLGESLNSLNLLDSKSWDEILKNVKVLVPKLKPGEWLIGRGWHQEKWKSAPEGAIGGYPTNTQLSAVSPNNPVILYHASGHALFANKKAMELAGITSATKDLKGGKIIRDSKAEPTGIFEENAMDLFNNLYKNEISKYSFEQKYSAWQKLFNVAQSYCLENGITGFHDAGVDVGSISFYKRCADENKFKIRMWVMIHDSVHNIQKISNQLPIIGYQDRHLTVRAIKQYIDGALGSHGAWLLKPYEDKAESTGQNVLSLATLEEMANFAYNQGMQLCVHAIGDKGNHEVLNLYENIFKRDLKKTNLRWRIEHAQHVDVSDFKRFKALGVIASMQAIHCTSDAPFVVKRLGEERAKNESYAWRTLLDSGARIANGTDTPVEKINPFECIYAAVTRKRLDTGLEFYPEQKMTREEGLLSYTLWNAYAAFEEDIKGSITVGKLADVIVLDTDIYRCSEEKIPQTKVLQTIIGGKIVYERK